MIVMFTGKERDAETGLDYFGARYFGSTQGRFTSPDAPLADQKPGDPQSWNLYTYGRNNPLRYMDPTGRNACGHDDDTKCKVTVHIGSRTKDEDGNYDDQFAISHHQTRRQEEYNAIATVIVEDSREYEETLGAVGPTVSQQSFLLKSTPSSEGFATLANGSYSGTAVNHHGTPAIALNGDRPVPIVTDVNPNSGAQGTATGIRVHAAGVANFTGMPRTGGAVSMGCQTVCTSQYSRFQAFTGLVPSEGPQQKAFTVKVYTNENVSRRRQ